MARQHTAEEADRHRGEAVLDRVVPKILLNYEEAAWSLGISKKGLYNLVSRERIPTVKVGGKVCFSPRDLEDFADAHRSG